MEIVGSEVQQVEEDDGEEEYHREVWGDVRHDEQEQGSGTRCTGGHLKRLGAEDGGGSVELWKFSANASEQKQLAARDYTNLLQCAIPVFDGLLPEPHNAVVHRLLFLLGEWHALAKLRMHTEHTVALLETTTSELAGHIRTFMDTTCQVFETVETTKEYATRLKRSVKKKQKEGSDGPVSDQSANHLATQVPVRHGSASDDLSAHHTKMDPGSSALASTECSEPPAQPPPSLDSGSSVAPSTVSRKGRLRKSLNLQTYKYHALRDYAEHIRRFGMTDSYSSERGEMEHKLTKSWILWTNKKAYRRQLARIERQRANLQKIRVKRRRYCSYAITKSQSAHQPLSKFLPVEGTFRHDPALKDFLPDLQEHLCQRMEVVLQD
ncbi:hypothetical protein BKA70DRAFT_1455022 [Coprinopsis sp. MPI-PUGE-AT-0042]|nr:hypothetical protein BKA70DRAFT_1455022 [Coprinopsis sp. MPI-PUGE-AT-0042]